MAYREFHYEKQYAAPDNSQAYATQVQGITNLFRGLQQKQEQRRRAEDQFQYDLDKGAFENDTKILTHVAKNVTARGKNEFRSSGRLSMDTERLMIDGKGWQQQSANQLERAKQLRQNIADREKDLYYNSQPDIDLLREATHGKDNDVDFRTRGERLAQAEQRIGGIDTFKFDKYRADYVKQIGSQWKDIETPLKSGASKSVRYEATFWDTDKGVPGVTDKDAIRFIDSDSRMAQYYDAKVSRDLDEEIKSMKTSGDDRTAWMKGKTNAEIKTELINDPGKNLINKEEYGIRVRNQAKTDLTEADRINSKVSYTNVGGDKNGSGGRWANPNILHDNTVNSLAQEAKSDDGQMSTVTTYGPGGRFTQKSGKPIQIDTTNPVRTDTDKGITTRANKGNLRFNMTGYMLMPIKKGQAPFALKAKTPEGMIEEINNMPAEYFNPDGKMALQPDLKIGLNGYTINEAGVLNDVQDQLFNISSQMADATKIGDKEKLATLQNMEYNLQELKDMVAGGDYDQQDLITAGNKAGVRKIQNNYIIPADQSDLSTIKNVTGGFDLKDKSYWSPEMQAVDAAYKARYEKAKAEGFGAKKESVLPIGTTYEEGATGKVVWNGKNWMMGNDISPYDGDLKKDMDSGKLMKENTTLPKTSGLPTITTADDYAKLPSGSEYLGPDGKKRKKK